LCNGLLKTAVKYTAYIFLPTLIMIQQLMAYTNMRHIHYLFILWEVNHVSAVCIGPIVIAIHIFFLCMTITFNVCCFTRSYVLMPIQLHTLGY